jgi:poly(3-hydroxybutyrate) depolymerase
MRTSFGLGMMILLVAGGVASCTGGEEKNPTGSAGTTGAAGTGSAGTGSAGTGTSGTGAAGTGSAGTGAAGTGSAGTGSAGTGVVNNDGGVDMAPSNNNDGGPRDVVSADGTAQSRHVKRPTNMPYAKNGYWEYLPPGYGDGTKKPLLVFWHGVGENGTGSATDLNKVALHGPPKNINMNKWPAEWPFVVLSPQHAGGGCPTATEVRDFFTYALGKYDVDPARTYLTGLSCGGRGGFAYLGMFKGEQVPAAVLIAADASAAYNAGGCDVVKQVGLWVFHGGNDNPAGDRAGMMNFMNCAQPRKEVKYQEFAGVDHVGSWEKVYDDPTLMAQVVAWLLTFTK